MSRPRIRPLPSVAELHALYRYDPDNGDIIFKRRPDAGKHREAWNRKYVDKVAGTIMNTGYLFIRVRDQSLLGHRVAWALYHGQWPSGELDHRDGDKLNNAIANLRLASRGQNARNRPGRAKSGYKGVTLSRGCSNRWAATIQFNRLKIPLGNFSSPEEAHAAYVEAAQRLHGDYAHLGVINVGTISATVVITGVAA